MRTCLNIFEILAVDRAILEAAENLPGSDFEDNIQIAAAVRADLDRIVTRDPSGFAASPIAVLTAQELLTQLAADTSHGA